VVDWGVVCLLQPLPISHHFHGYTALLVLRFVVVKWRYMKYWALPFFRYASPSLWNKLPASFCRPNPDILFLARFLNPIV